MKYTVADFYFLQSAAENNAQTLEDVYGNMCTYLGAPVPMSCLLHAIRGLVAGGYIEVKPDEGRMISAVTPLSITPVGKNAVAISLIHKLLGEHKAFCKNQIRFCELERPEITDDGAFTADGVSFDDCIGRLIRAGDISHPMFEINDLGEGYLKMTVHHPNDGWYGMEDDDEGEEENDSDVAALCYSASVTGTAEQIKAGLRDLIDTAYFLVTEPPRPRKVALHGGDGSLLIALANAANEQGMTSFRMTVSKIRFNRQRFVGKRDGDLDYAQCGDPIFIYETASAAGFCHFDIMKCAVMCPELLSEEDFDKLAVIHKETRKLFM